MIRRKINSLLRSAFRESPSITLTGPRQSGKTTLLQTMFPQASYVHLEEPDILDFAHRDPRGFLGAYSRPVIYDEIQYAPHLLPYLKAEIDRNRNTPGQFLLTGSQSFTLMTSMTESLAGRTVYLELLPFSSVEVTKNVAAHSVEETIFRGFYPEPYTTKRYKNLESFTRWQASYIRTFIERDVRRISNVGDLNQFERFVRLAAGRSGSLLNLSELGRDAGVEQPTAKRWHSVLQAGFILFELLPDHRNFSKRLVKSPKLYFYDVGLCRYLMGIKEQTQLRVNQAFGALFETLVIADIKKHVKHVGANAELTYFRSSDGQEVDLLLSIGKTIYPFEIKATATPRMGDLGGLRTWLKLSDQKEGFVLCLIDKKRSLGEGITALPWWEHAKIWE